MSGRSIVLLPAFVLVLGCRSPVPEPESRPAAPVPSATIAEVAACYRDVAAIVDLRAEGRQDPPPTIAPVVTLDDVFAGVQDAIRASEARIGAARRDIRECARAFASRAKLNPSGWHDLCA